MLIDIIGQKLIQIDYSSKLDCRQLRTLCLKQEQQVMFHLKATKFDIYDEISKVCPSQVNLKTASNQELITRINSMGQINSFPQNNPSPKSINEEDPDIETGENAMNIGFTFDQPSIKNFLDLEQNYEGWQMQIEIQDQIIQ